MSHFVFDDPDPQEARRALRRIKRKLWWTTALLVAAYGIAVLTSIFVVTLIIMALMKYVWS